MTAILDTSEVQRNLARLDQSVLPLRIRKGLAAAGNRLLVDSMLQSPTVPIHRGGYGGRWERNSTTGYSTFTRETGSGRVAGELRASGALFVDGVKMRTTLHYGEMASGQYQPQAYGGQRIPVGSHEACVVFNAPYAAEQHEHWEHKTQPGAGTHYLAVKLYGNGLEYMAMIAEAVRL